MTLQLCPIQLIPAGLVLQFPWQPYCFVQVPFTFTGLRKSIVNARLMVDYLMEDLKDIQKLIESREELDYQLSRLRMDSQPTNYPAPSRRTHGHSSAVSSQEGALKDSMESEMQGRWVLGKRLGTVCSSCAVSLQHLS